MIATCPLGSSWDGVAAAMAAAFLHGRRKVAASKHFTAQPAG
jgi:hypothetical protein